MSTRAAVLKRNAKISKLVEKMRSLRSLRSKPTSPKAKSTVAAKKALLFKGIAGKESTQQAAQEALQELGQAGLSRTPTIYEEDSAIEEIAEDIKLREAEAVPELEQLCSQQAEAYAKGVYDAIIAGSNIFDVAVPNIKELTAAYARQMAKAITTGDAQMLAQLGLPKKASKIPASNVKSVASILARNYVEKRSMDMRFELLKASVMYSIDTLLGESKADG